MAKHGERGRTRWRFLASVDSGEEEEEDRQEDGRVEDDTHVGSVFGPSGQFISFNDFW